MSIQPINDKNGVRDEIDIMWSCSKFKSWDGNEFSRLQNPVVLLVKKSSCVDRSTHEIRKSTHKNLDVGVSKSKIRVSHPPTQQIFAVCATRRVPLRRPFFPCVAIFRRNYFRVDTVAWGHTLTRPFLYTLEEFLRSWVINGIFIP